MARFAVVALGALVLAALLAGPAQARIERSLLPGTLPWSSTALQTSSKIKTCAGDLWFGISDSAKDVAGIVKECAAEEFDLVVRSLWEDMQKVAAAVAVDMRTAAKQCPNIGAARCVKEVLGMAARQVKPVALLVAKGVHLVSRIGISGLLDILGCSLLPAFLPFVWDTLMDLIIFGQCLLQ